MFDDMDRLREMKGLSTLLTHYAELAAPDRQVWQDRVQELEGVEPRELVRLHGELLACGWLEQNTGVTPVLKQGFAPACYRVTPAGLRILKQYRAEERVAVATCGVERADKPQRVSDGCAESSVAYASGS